MTELQTINTAASEPVPERNRLVPIMGPKEPLPKLIDRASQTLARARTYGEVLEAREVARLAYDAAKSEARIQRARQAHAQILHDLTCLKVDSLAIQVRAEMRLAEEVDAAQARGELAKAGDNQHSEVVSCGNDLGLRRKEIHEARKLRAAEAANPGIVERALDDIVSRGEEPTRAALKREIVQKAAPRKVMNPRALWLWGRLKDFERDGVLAEDITDLLNEMTASMRADVRRLLPKVNAFLTEMEKAAGTTDAVAEPSAPAQTPAQRLFEVTNLYVRAAHDFGEGSSEFSDAELLAVHAQYSNGLVESALKAVQLALKDLQSRVSAAKKAKRDAEKARKETEKAAKAAERAAASALRAANPKVRKAAMAAAQHEGDAA